MPSDLIKHVNDAAAFLDGAGESHLADCCRRLAASALAAQDGQAVAPIGYLSAYQIKDMQAGHAKWIHCWPERGWKGAEGDTPIYLAPAAQPQGRDGLREAVSEYIERTPCDCSDRRRDEGNHLSGCPLFDMSHCLARAALASPQADEQTLEEWQRWFNRAAIQSARGYPDAEPPASAPTQEQKS